MEELVRRRRAQEEGWEDVAWPDYGILGFTAVHQLVVLGVVVHLVRNRDWPPYVTKNVALVSGRGVLRVLLLIIDVCLFLRVLHPGVLLYVQQY